VRGINHVRLREVREQRKISLRQLAAQVGMSAALISQVERGVTSPSLETLRKLAQALDEPLFNLLDEPEERRVAVVRRERRLRLLPPDGAVAYERISPGFGRLEVLEGVLQPGDASSPAPWGHPSEECAVVLEGELDIEVDGETHSLSAGDSIYFDSRLPHLYRNESQHRTVYIVAITPPSY
jgi:transcriptional regulator with XRE-family HTH domain